VENLTANAKAQALLLDKLVENPALIETFDEKTTQDMLETAFKVMSPLLKRFLRDACAREDEKARRSNDRLLSREEIAERLHCTVQHISRGWRAGRYPFMLKDGARLVGSEEGLERWIKARTRSIATRSI
jgi:hypothetical protein